MYNMTPLPIINNAQPFYTSRPLNQFGASQSLSHNYFKYAKDALKYGNLNNVITNSTPFHPYHSSHQMSLDPDPYHQLYSREGMVYRRLQNNNVVPSFTLPKINHDNNEEIRDGEIVYFPNNTLVPLSHVDHYIKKNTKNITNNKQQDTSISSYLPISSNMIKQFSQMNLLRKKNVKKWTFVRSVVYMISLYKTILKFTKMSLDVKGNKLLHIQAAKEALTEIRTFILPSLGNLEMFCVQFFHSTIRYNTNDIEKQKNSVFIVKSFIHQLFSDLTAAFARNDDIPGKIRKLFRMYICEGVVLPYGFLSTFEFNRLEFDKKIRLVNMTKERKGMMVCFILLYRVLLIEIFKRHYTYFPQIKAMEPNENIIEEELTRRVHQGARQRERSNEKELENEYSRSRSRKRNEEQGDRRKESRKRGENTRGGDIREEDGRNRDDRRNYNRSRSKTNQEGNKKRSNHDENRNKRELHGQNELRMSNMREQFERKSKKTLNKISTKQMKSMHSIKLLPPNPPQRSQTYLPSNKQRQNRQQDKRLTNDKQDQHRSPSRSKSRAMNDSDNFNKSKSISKPKPHYNQYDRKESRSRSKSRTMNEEDRRHRNHDSHDRRDQGDSYGRRHRTHHHNYDRSKSRDKLRLPEILNKFQIKGNHIQGTILDNDLGDRQYMRRKNEINEGNEIMRSRERVKEIPNRLRETIRKEKKKKLREKITHNFNFLINVLHHIFYSPFLENVDIFNDDFKERHCFNLMVYKKEGSHYDKSDEIELIKGVVLNTKVTDNFIRQNDRWIQMYKLNTIQFCCDFAKKAMKE